MARKFYRFLMLTSAALLLSCGGGGGDGGGGNPVLPTQQTIDLTVGADANLPVAAAQAVTSFVSPVGKGAIGETKHLPASSNVNDQFIAGLDASENPLLLAFGDGSVVLSAETTAIALVRIAAGAESISAGPVLAADFSAAVKLSPSYPAFISAINSSLAAGLSPIGNDVVLDLTWQVLIEVQGTLQPKAASAGTKRPAAVAPLTSASLPYYFWNNSAYDAISITDIPASPNVQLNNRTFLVWKVTSQPDGGPLTTVTAPALKSTVWQLVAWYGASESKTSITGSSELPFTVRVFQDQDTVAENVFGAVTNVIFSALSLTQTALNISPQTNLACAQRLAQILSNTPQASAFLGHPSFQTFQDYVNRALKDIGLGALRSNCAFSSDQATAVSATMSIVVPSWSRVWSALNNSKKAFAGGAGLAQLVQYQFTSALITICKSNTPACKADTAIHFSPLPPLESGANQPILFSASVESPAPIANTPPTGSVVFQSLGTTLCAGQLQPSGFASCTFTPLAAASYSVTAVYSGDSSYRGSSSASTQLAILPPPLETFDGINKTITPTNIPGQSIFRPFMIFSNVPDGESVDYCSDYNYYFTPPNEMRQVGHACFTGKVYNNSLGYAAWTVITDGANNFIGFDTLTVTFKDGRSASHSWSYP